MTKLTPRDVPGFDLCDPMHHLALNLLNYGGGAGMGAHALQVNLRHWPAFVRRMVDDPAMRKHIRRPPIDPGELAGWDGRNPEHHMAMWLLADAYPRLDAETIATVRARWPDAVAELLATAETLQASIKPSPFAAPEATSSRAQRRRARGPRPAWWPFK